MAAFVATGLVNRYQDRSKNDYKHLADALAGGTDAAQKSLSVNILGMPDFEVRGATDTNTASGAAFNLSDLLVPFTPDTGRIVYVESYAWNGTGAGYQVNQALIRGGATGPFVDKTGLVADQKLGTELTSVVVQNNKVVVQSVGISGDVVTWYLKAWIGEAFPLVLL